MNTPQQASKIEFVKGHCGWDALTILPEGRVPPERELQTALSIIDAPFLGGLEAGFLGKGARAGEIRMRMVSSTARDWIPMCGGMTQVVGKALVETFFRDLFGIDVTQPRVSVKLMTASGAIPIEIEIDARRATRTTTIMDDYAAFLYRKGVTPVTLQGIEALDVGGEFVVFDIASLQRAHPGLEFRARTQGPHLQVVTDFLQAYQRHLRIDTGVSGMMYERGGEGPGQFRLYPRFWSTDASGASVPFEFQCGTGTVAVGLALAHRGLLPFESGPGSILFEWGSRRVTRDPYGIRTSTLDLSLGGGRVTKARFSHSVVEILCEGAISLPGYLSHSF